MPRQSSSTAQAQSIRQPPRPKTNGKRRARASSQRKSSVPPASSPPAAHGHMEDVRSKDPLSNNVPRDVSRAGVSSSRTSPDRHEDRGSRKGAAFKANKDTHRSSRHRDERPAAAALPADDGPTVLQELSPPGLPRSPLTWRPQAKNGTGRPSTATLDASISHVDANLGGGATLDLSALSIGTLPTHRDDTTPTQAAQTYGLRDHIGLDPAAMLLKARALESALTFRPPRMSLSTLSQDERYHRIRDIFPDYETLMAYDYPKPEPYNSSYPHPISVYASPAVNPSAVAASDYKEILARLAVKDPKKLKGDILSQAKPDNLLPPALSMLTENSGGNGIPESLCEYFESFGGARLQVGVGSDSPFSQAHAPPNSRDLESLLSPPSLLAAPQLKAGSYANREASVTFSDRFALDKWATMQTSTKTRVTHDLEASPKSQPRVTKKYAADTVSPWYKTELCYTWEGTGTCKYGSACQFAHGPGELRTPARVLALPSPPTAACSLDPRYSPEGCRPVVAPRRKTSLPGATPPARVDIRRPSLPLSSLSTVAEHDTFPQDQTVPLIAPIGSERCSPPPSRKNSRGLLPDLFQAKSWMASSMPELDSGHMPKQSINTRASLSSLSSTSSSHIPSPETPFSNEWSPLEHDKSSFDRLYEITHDDEVAHRPWDRPKRAAARDYTFKQSIWH